MVIGYDLTDKFYNSTDGSTLIRSWFENNIASVMQKYGVNIFLEYVGVDNKILKPGPVFLKIARHAYDIGADYMYRVNDDTEVSGLSCDLLYVSIDILSVYRALAKGVC